MSPASKSAMPTTPGSPPASTAIVFDEPAVAVGRCARRRARHARDRAAAPGAKPSSASTRSCSRAARPSGSMRRAACRPGCASRAAASRSGRCACRSCRARSCSTCSTAATRTGAAFRPIAISAMRPPRVPAHDFALGSAGAGFGATTVNLKGGLGSASAHDARRRHGRRARRRQRRRQRHGRRRPAFLGGAVRAGRRIRRTRLARSAAARSAGDPHQGRRCARTPPSRWSRPTRRSPRRRPSASP